MERLEPFLNYGGVMSYDGLRDWLTQVDAMGELRTLEGIDWNLEMGAVVDVLYPEHPPHPPSGFGKVKVVEKQSTVKALTNINCLIL
jgi:hypothetical protein